MKKLLLILMFAPLFICAQEKSVQITTFSNQGVKEIFPRISIQDRVDGTKVIYEYDKNGIQNLLPSLYVVPSTTAESPTKVYTIYKANINGLPGILPFLEIKTTKIDDKSKQRTPPNFNSGVKRF